MPYNIARLRPQIDNLHKFLRTPEIRLTPSRIAPASRLFYYLERKFTSDNNNLFNLKKFALSLHFVTTIFLTSYPQYANIKLIQGVGENISAKSIFLTPFVGKF